MTDQPILPPEHKRRIDKLTSVRVSRNVSKPFNAPVPRPHPIIADLHEWPDYGDGMEADAVQDMGVPLGEQRPNMFSFSPLGVPNELAHDEQPDSAFDSMRAEMHAQYLMCLAANREMCGKRKQQVEGSLLTAITALVSQCPSCGSNEVWSPGPPVIVVWVGSSYRFELAVPICHCSFCRHIFSVKPLEVNCMPATAVHSWDLTKAVYGSRPIWFDMDLLQAIDTEMCVIKRQSMDRRCDVLMRLHEQSGCGGVSLSYDTLRKRLSEAVRELGYLLAACADMQSLGASDYPQGLLSDCGACWRAGQSSEGHRQPLHSLFIDLCFKLNHLRRADIHGDVWEVGSKTPPYSRFFIHDNEVLQHLRDPDSSQAPEDSQLRCSDFKADEVLGRRPGGKNDITALAVCLCRHGHIAYLMNSFTGERHAYATLFLKAVLGCIQMLLFVWYDINCRWAPSFGKWLATQAQTVRAKAARLQFPLPRMHYYAHRPECQQEYGHLHMEGAGRSNGEPHEIFNAHFGPLGKTTMYMTRLNREARLERASAFYTEQKTLQLPAQLLRMKMRALGAAQDSRAAVERIVTELQDQGLTSDQMQEGMRALAVGPSSCLAAMSWEAELANCTLILHKAGLADGDTCTPALALIFEDQALAKLAPNSAQVKRARKRQQDLMSLHSAELAGKDIAVGTGDFKPFLAAFVHHKVLSLREELEAKAVQYAHLQALMPALAERSNEQAKIMKAVQRVVRVMDTKATALQSWLSGDFVETARLPASFAQLRSGCADWDLKGFHRGVFPWRTSQADMHGKSELELLTELALRINEHHRAQEELTLIEEEMASCMQLYERQASALHDALAVLPQSPSRSGGAEEGSSLSELIQRCSAVKIARKQDGIRLLLQDKLEKVTMLRAHAERSFSLARSGNMQQALAEGASASHYAEVDYQAASDTDEE